MTRSTVEASQMPGAPKPVSIVTPFYNEAGGMTAFHSRLTAVPDEYIGHIYMETKQRPVDVMRCHHCEAQEPARS